MKKEVIAKRYNASVIIYIITIIIGLLIIIIGSIVGVQREDNATIAVCVVIGAIILAIGVYFLYCFLIVPKITIVYKGGILYLPKNVSCRPEELENINLTQYSGRYGAMSKHGKLMLTVRGKVYTYRNIEDIAGVYHRLCKLNKQAVNNLEQSSRVKKTKLNSEEIVSDISE